MIEKPYYRIYRPCVNIENTPHIYDYICDKRNCNYRKEIIRYFKILEKEIIDILEYIELSNENMDTYSLKIYKTFLSICTEIENNFKGILYANNYKIGKKLNMPDDYFKLEKILKLSKYKVEIHLTDYGQIICPFEEWNDSTNYNPLEWYQNYNELKHNRSTNIKKANLKNLIKSFCALYIILYSEFYEYSNIVDVGRVITLVTDDDDMIIDNSTGIISLKERPIWEEEEKYNFDWELLKKSDSSYDVINIF